MNKAIPLLGGFNDGKHVKPKGRCVLNLACPIYCKSLNNNTAPKFGYESYTLKSFFIENTIVYVYAIEGLTTEKIVQKLISGYMKNRKKYLTLSHI